MTASIPTVPMFDREPGPARDDPIDPRAVPCPQCGAPAGTKCKLRGARARDPFVTVSHQARVALARLDAGIADEPTASLF